MLVLQPPRPVPSKHPAKLRPQPDRWGKPRLPSIKTPGVPRQIRRGTPGKASDQTDLRSNLPGLQAKADRNRPVHLIHQRAVQTAHMLPQAAFIQGADLLQQHHRVLGQAAVLAHKLNVGGDVYKRQTYPSIFCSLKECVRHILATSSYPKDII